MGLYPLQKAIHKKGYFMVSISHKNQKKTKLVHRLVCSAFHGEPQLRQEVRHLDGNPANNAPENLKWGTTKENWMDKRNHGNATIGEKHPMSKLSNEQRLEIKQLSKEGKSQREIAKDYNVSQGAIWRVLNKTII